MTLTVERAYLTVTEAADLWRVSVPSVYRWVAAGRVPAIRVGGSGPIRIPASAIAPPETDTPPERRAPGSAPAVEARAHGGEAA
jgi:excisionase family DNA binding protein